MERSKELAEEHIPRHLPAQGRAENKARVMGEPAPEEEISWER